MSPKDTALELFKKFKNPFDRNGCIPPNEIVYYDTAKQIALIAVDQILEATMDDYINNDYWKEVKHEIELL